MAPLVPLLLLLFPTLHALFLPSNLSIFPFYLSHSPPPLSPTPILDEILRAVSKKERWDPRGGGIRVSELDAESARTGVSEKCEFHVKVGTTVLWMQFGGGAVDWRKVERFGPEFLEFGGGFGGDPAPALEIQGPLDLRVAGGEEMELYLPALNVTAGGLKQILVSYGITIRIEDAQSITLSHPHDIGLLFAKSSVQRNQKTNQFQPFGVGSCAPLLSVWVVRSAAVVAFRTSNSEAHVKTVFHTNDTVELVSEKCYTVGHSKQVPSWLFGKLILLEKDLRKFLGSGILQGWPARLLKVKITSSNMVKFRLELERDITENDRTWKKVTAWRTRPATERMWFEVLARLEAGRGWNKLVVRKLTKPLLAVESSSWSSLMSNISFTQISSILLPPEALTLDVNW